MKLNLNLNKKVDIPIKETEKLDTNMNRPPWSLPPQDIFELPSNKIISCGVSSSVNSLNNHTNPVVASETAWLNKKAVIGHVQNGGGIIQSDCGYAIKFISSKNCVQLQILFNGKGAAIKTQSWNRTKKEVVKVIKEVPQSKPDIKFNNKKKEESF